jgi:hypothetical protein
VSALRKRHQSFQAATLASQNRVLLPVSALASVIGAFRPVAYRMPGRRNPYPVPGFPRFFRRLPP